MILRKYFWLICSLPWERASSDKSFCICLSKAVLSLTASKDSAVNLYPSWSFSNTEGNCVSNVAHRRLTSPRSISGDFSLLRSLPGSSRISTSASSGLSPFPSVGDLGSGIAACSPATSGKDPSTTGTAVTWFTPSLASKVFSGVLTSAMLPIRHTSQNKKTSRTFFLLIRSSLWSESKLFSLSLSLSLRLLFLNGFCITLRAFQKSQKQNLRFGKTGVSLVFVSVVLFQKRVVA